MGVQTAKFASIGVMFSTCIVSGVILPYVILRLLSTKCNTSSFNRVLGLMNCFSGGVFLSTALLGILPEAREVATEAFPVLSTDYPLTELLLMSGFLAILIIECISTTLILGRGKVSDNTSAQQENKPGQNANLCVAAKENTNCISTIDIPIMENGCACALASNGIISKEEITHQNSVKTTEAVTIEKGEIDHVHPTKLTNLRSYAVIVALSIHMLFDGLGVGLLEEDADVWAVLGAISIHKILIFFSMGLNLCENNTLKKFIIAMVYMSLVSPLGVGVGVAITSDTESPTLLTVSAVLQGVSAGTFLYVAILEVLSKEFQAHNDNWRIPKSFAAVVGCAVFAVVKYFLHEG